MTALSENPAVLDPAKVLTQTQKNALIAVSFYRHQHWRDGKIQIGPNRFTKATIAALQQMELLRKDRAGLSTTIAGKVAIERLKEGGK